MIGVFKNQIDWLPLELGSLRATQGRTLAVMQVSGGSQLFAAPAAAQASISLVAFASELGPLRGMLPPIHDKIDCDGLAIAELLEPSI